MKKKSIQGKVKFQNLDSGFWSIVDDEGTMWRVIDMPKNIQKENLVVKANVKEINNDLNTYLNGTPVRLMSFSFLG